MMDKDKLQFKDIELEDLSNIKNLINDINFRGSDYAVGSIFIWRKVLKSKIAYFNNSIIIKTNDKNISYLYPFGDNNIEENLDSIRCDATLSKQPFRLQNVNQIGISNINKLFPGKYSFFPSRNDFDYIYKVEDLVELKGKKYHSKKNLINKFNRLYGEQCDYETITKNNLHECVELYKKWITNKDVLSNDQSVLDEKSAIFEAFDHYFALNLIGGLLRVDGSVIAFSIGEHLNDDTFLIHFEKSLINYPGSYQKINQEFLINNCTDYLYVNREDDAGSDVLRKSKLSYKPCFLEKKYIVRITEQLSEQEINILNKLG